MGYWESDFLGQIGNPPNGGLAVSSNPYVFRLRLYWVDVTNRQVRIPGRPVVEPDDSESQGHFPAARRYLLFARHRRELPVGLGLGPHPRLPRACFTPPIRSRSALRSRIPSRTSAAETAAARLHFRRWYGRPTRFRRSSWRPDQQRKQRDFVRRTRPGHHRQAGLRSELQVPLRNRRRGDRQ